MNMRGRSPFTTVRSEGGLLPVELLSRLAHQPDSLPGTTPADYHLPTGWRLRDAINRSWTELQGAWATFGTELAQLGTGERATTLTRERWLVPLFAELGYGRLARSTTLSVEGHDYPVSHMWGPVPVHLLGADVDLDRRTKGVAGAAGASPHSMVQDLLNRSGQHLWGIVSNGRLLRVLRDNTSLTRALICRVRPRGHVHRPGLRRLRGAVDGLPPKPVRSRAPGTVLGGDLGRRVQTPGRASPRQPADRVRAGHHRPRRGVPGPPRQRDAQGRAARRGPDQATITTARSSARLPAGVPASRRRPRPAAPRRHHGRCSGPLHQLLLPQQGARPGRQHRGTRHSDLWESVKPIFAALDKRGIPAAGVPALGSFLWSADACRRTSTPRAWPTATS